MRFFLCLTILWMFPFFAAAAEMEDSSHVKVELLQEEETIQSGRPFWVALHFKLEEGWHVYWKNPGDAGIPLKIEWKLPPGFEAGPIQWPFPEKFAVAEIVGFGYEQEVTLLSQITPPAHIDSEKLSLGAQINWLVCSASTCQPGSASVDLPLKAAANDPSFRQNLAEVFEQARAKIPQTHIEVKTVRRDGIVQLEVPQETSNSGEETIKDAYFFPEQKNMIDHSIDPTIAPSETESNRYLVNLKESEEIGAGSKSLKGVLVLYTQKEGREKIQAFDIDSPIEEEKEWNFLSLLDTPASIGNGGIISQSSSPLAFEGGLGLALLFAFVGGMILNLMPCVLPVISFKVLSFVKMAGQSRSLTIKHGCMFSLGVMISFWILASIMLILRAYGQAVGWGFQLQEPLFVVILASLLFIFSLSLFGVFEWGIFFASWAGQTEVETKQQSSGYLGSFLSGVLATAVATPCTGPFLGSAVGFAVTLPVFQSLLIFTFLGLGMCFPYLLLAVFPSLLRFMPKPGAWMEVFKQLMAFMLLATVLWLFWVFSAQTDAFSLVCLLAGFLCFAIGAWIYGRDCTPWVSRKKRIASYACVLFFALIGCEAILFPRASWYSQETLAQASPRGHWDGWEDFSPERIAQLRKEGKAILIDFTAKWCLICQANHFVLSSEEVNQRLNDLGVVRMKADWTKSDPRITEALSQFGRNSVPLYVLYGSDQSNPVILPQVLTTEVVMDHLNQMNAKEIALK